MKVLFGSGSSRVQLRTGAAAWVICHCAAMPLHASAGKAPGYKLISTLLLTSDLFRFFGFFVERAFPKLLSMGNESRRKDCPKDREGKVKLESRVMTHWHRFKSRSRLQTLLK